jgi:hypothetical protein
MVKLAFLLGLIATPAWGQAIVLSACGTGNYTNAIGTLHQLTMDPAGYLCVSTTTTTARQVEEPSGKPSEKPGPEPKR